MVKATSAQKFKKVPQIAAETVEGTPNSSATFANIGGVLSLSIKKDGNWVEISQLGKVDLLALIQGLQTYESQVKLACINTDFAGRFFNVADEASPADTPAETFTMVCSVYLDGTENFIIFSGSRPKDASYTREAGKADEWSFSMEHTNIGSPITTANGGLTTPTFDTAASGAVISWLSGGSNSVSWGGTELNCKKISVSVNLGTAPDHTIGNPDPFGTQYHGRRVSWDMDVLWTNDDIEVDFGDGTSRTLAIVVISATSTMTLTSAYATSHNKDFNSDDNMGSVEKVTGKCLSIALT